jgi:hypothetical protein
VGSAIVSVLVVANISACGVSGLLGAQSSTVAYPCVTGAEAPIPTSKNAITIAARRFMVRTYPSWSAVTSFTINEDC